MDRCALRRGLREAVYRAFALAQMAGRTACDDSLDFGQHGQGYAFRSFRAQVEPDRSVEPLALFRREGNRLLSPARRFGPRSPM